MYSFTRYLAAKKTVDDRALNRVVLDQFSARLHRLPAPRCLELGAGIGTMLERLETAGIVAAGEYLGIDNDPDNITRGLQRLERQRFPNQSGGAWRVNLQTEDALSFCGRGENRASWDVLIAHAFLDLFDLPTALPQFLLALKPGGLGYFTVNFDGETIFEPAIDPVFDALVIHLYHRSMDERVTDGRPSGDSRSGRHLFDLLRRNGMLVEASGSSDWVVFPSFGSYPNDEAYFLHHILYFFEQSLGRHPELESQRFQDWLKSRHAQVERAELIFIAHQLDFLATKQAD